ncbi:MAG TPA: protein kinase [Thermoanaerobaculia bacterium]|nr:protein kinase [Thermoanaerobaculia bacterium]
MTLSPGTRLGPYELVAPVGAGGMGEVYRARDTRLERTVAVKVLPAHLSSSAESRQRFEREAKTISQLSHPHICALYDVGNQDGVEFLVMEYLEGETLSDRLLKGPLAFDQVLRFGIEIVDALDKAHRQGIVHRDLKPGNVMITKSGVKLLDFGLAKAVAPAGKTSGAALTALPTQAGSNLTQEGTILGTFQYMAPEQLEGREADARTDIFAFGCVLYEMATGQKAFSGKSQASLISSIMGSQPPPVSAVSPMTPPAFDRVVRTCLAKDADDRWQTAHDVMLELKWVAEGGSAAGLPAPVVAKRKNRERFWMAASAILGIATVLLAVRSFRPSTSETRPVRLSLLPPANAAYESMTSMAVSPDGRQIAFVGQTVDARRSLWVRDLDALKPRSLAGTDGATLPFWSPDNRFLGFFADGKLKKIDASGGPPQVLAPAPFPGGGTWSRDAVIVFTPNIFDPLYRVSASGGTAVPVTKLGPREEAHRSASFLPDGRHVVFMADARRTEDHRIKIADLDSGKVQDLLGAVSNVAFAQPGFLLFVRAGSLLAQPFDPKRLRLAGEPVVVGESLTESGATNHQFEFSVSESGVLAYRSADARSQLTWVDRNGRPLGRIGEPVRRGLVGLSPAGNQVAYEQLDADGRNADLWLLDVSRATTSRFTFDPASEYAPIWSPDGSRIVFGAYRKDAFEDLYLQSSAAGSQESLLLRSGDDKTPTSWSPDGRFILFESSTTNGIDLDVLSLEGSPKAEPFIHTQFDETRAVFSPDGKRVAYVSNESGREEIYVTSFPGHAGRRQVSTAGGTRPRWRADGRELFFGARGGKLMVVEALPNGDFGDPRELFQLRGARDYAVAADGQRFLVDLSLEDPSTTPVTVVLGWTGDSKK